MGIPYFPMYPTDFEAKTSHLTLEEDGAYNRLLRLMWMTPGCSVPDDPDWIARRMRIDAATFARLVSPIIAEFMTRRAGRILNSRLREEYEKADETYRRRSDAGKKGGRPKAIDFKQNGEKAGLSQPKAGPKQPEPEPEPIKEEPYGSKKKPDSKATQLPEGWVPSDRNITDAEAKGFSAKETQDEADRFRDYHRAKGTTFKDWDAGWRTWLGNARKFARGGMAVQANTGGGGRNSSFASVVARRQLEGEQGLPFDS